MPLPAVRGAQVVKALEKAGFTVTRVRGSHYRLKHPDGRSTTVPVHANRDIRPGTIRSILRDTDLTADELRRFL